MANVRSVVNNLFNGVSQQDDSLRLPNQGSVQENFYPSLVRGLVKRPPLKFISNYSSSSVNLPTHGQTHLVDRGGADAARSRCFIHVSKSGIIAIRPNGSLKQVIYGSGASSYLQAGSATPTYAITTIADHTFISNCKVKPGMNTSTTYFDTRQHCVIAIKQAVYGCTYSIELRVVYNGQTHYITAFYSTPPNTGTGDNPPPQLSLREISTLLGHQILTYLVENTDIIGAFVRTPDGYVMISMPNGGYIDFVQASASYSNTLMKVIFSTLQDAADLPPDAPPGMLIKITGTDYSEDNDYYVKFENGRWVETIGFLQEFLINASTMPHILVDMGSYFEFKKASWAQNKVGDARTNPPPEFLNNPITGIFQYRNRLGLMSGDIVALSEAAEFFNFFRTTVLVLKDSDPIFITASISGAPTLRHAVTFNEDIILFSDRAQYRLVAPDILSPATAAINVITQYRTDPDIPPVSAGNNIFFANKELGSAAVYEYYIDSDTGNKNAMCITSHVPRYIPDSVSNMTCSQALGLLVLHERDASELYLYKYYWAGSDKLQSAWFKFIFDGSISIRGTCFIDDLLYVLYKDSSTGLWSFGSLDFSDTRPSSEHLDLTRLPYTATYTFSRFYVRDKQNGNLPITSGRLQLQRCFINLVAPSGPITAKVYHLDGSYYEYTWTGFNLGIHGNRLGVIDHNKDYVFQFPLRATNDSIKITMTDGSWRPLTITSVAWEANYITKGVQLI